ncbi:MAG: ABC transporter ATP-binding protein/permease [Bacteroidales bacterium]|nr:ABC transporter ATP-binding protein/permease [Bacteroidales bacterium]
MKIASLFAQTPSAPLPVLARWLWHAAKRVHGRIVAVALLGVLRVGAGLTFVWLSKVIIDTATDGSVPVERLWWLAAALVGTMLAELALSQAVQYIRQLGYQKMANSMRHDIYSHLIEGDSFADTRHSGDLLNRLTIDVSTATDTATDTIPMILVTSVQLIGAFWLLCTMNTTLALCALIISPLAIISSKIYFRRMRQLNSQIRQNESRIHQNMQEGLQHRLVVSALQCQPAMTASLNLLQQNLLATVGAQVRLNLYSRTTVRLGFIAGYLTAFIWSIFELHAGVITFGIMTAFLQLVGRIQGPISALSSTIPGLVAAATAVDRLMEITADKDGEAETAEPRLQGKIGIKFQDVTFAYSPNSPVVVNHLTYDFAPGSKTVVMGPSGIGKSTLTKLMLAVLRPQQGSISVYGHDGSEPVSRATRRYMSYVPQGNSLLAGTIRQNLQLGNPDATEQQMRDALYSAAAEFVYDLPEGLDTPCGELGSSLSEGQCQRIAIARALLRETPILILDEFNSALDKHTADTLMQRLEARLPQTTVVFISHRNDITAHYDAMLALGAQSESR